MALSDRCFITLNNVKNYLNISESDGTKDTWLETVIDLACGRVEEEIGTCVQPQSTTEYLDGTGNTKIKLANYITNLVGADEAARLANLQYKGTNDAWANLIDNEDDLNFDDNVIEVVPSATYTGDVWGFPVGAKNIKVVYYAGFDPIPAKLKIVAIEMAAMMFKESDVGNAQLGANSINFSSAGNSASSTMKDMESRWQAVFDEYVENTPNVTVINI